MVTGPPGQSWVDLVVSIAVVFSALAAAAAAAFIAR